MRTIEQGAIRLPGVTTRTKEGERQFLRSTADLGLLKPPNIRRFIQNVAKGATFGDTSSTILKSADQEFYAAFDNMFEFTTKGEDGHQFFTRHMTLAHQQITDLWRRLCQTEANIHGFLTDVPTPESPTQLVMMLHSPYIPENVRYNLRRNANLALINAHFEKETEVGEEKLKNVSATIKTLLSPHTVESEDVYSLHKNKTNEALWVSDSGEPIPKLPNTHIKHHTPDILDVMDVGRVYFKERTKEYAGIKAIRKGFINAEKKLERKLLQPIIPSDVHDFFGMQFVVAEESSSDSPKVDLLMRKVQTAILTNFPKARVTPKHETKDDSHKSAMFHQKRFMVEFLENENDDLNDPNAKKILIEFMFHGKEEYLNNNYEIGSLIDSKTGKPNGPAHRLTEVERDLNILKLLHPRISRRNDVFPWDEIKPRSYERISQYLLDMDRVSPDEEKKLRRKFAQAA